MPAKWEHPGESIMRTFSGRIAIGILSFCVSQTMAGHCWLLGEGFGGHLYFH